MAASESFTRHCGLLILLLLLLVFVTFGDCAPLNTRKQ